MSDSTGETRCERCRQPVDSGSHRAVCGHPLAPITDEELAGLRAAYEQQVVAAIGFATVAKLLDKIDQQRAELDTARAAVARYRSLRGEAEDSNYCMAGYTDTCLLRAGHDGEHGQPDCYVDSSYPCVNPEDLRVDVFSNSAETHARITHLPTGLVGVGHDPDSPRSGLAAKAVAMRALKEALADAQRVGISNANTAAVSETGASTTDGVGRADA